jgi:hypothetical protein
LWRERDDLLQSVPGGMERSLPYVERHGGATGLTGLGATLVALAIPALYPALPRWIAWAVLVSGLLLFAVGLIAMARKRGLSADSTIQGNQPHPASAQRLTSRQIFERDFPHLLKYSGEIAMNAGGTDLEIRFQVYMDHAGGSKFVGFFVPRLPPGMNPETRELPFHVCEELVGSVVTVLSDMDATVLIEAGGVGEQPVAQERLVFSGRVFLYHEDYLTPAQLVALTDLYKTRGYEVQFRGPDYFSYHIALRRPAD